MKKIAILVCAVMFSTGLFAQSVRVTLKEKIAIVNKMELSDEQKAQAAEVLKTEDKANASHNSNSDEDKQFRLESRNTMKAGLSQIMGGALCKEYLTAVEDLGKEKKAALEK